ncbi:uncharacterized protein LOC114724059 [Neltuma alba]|uniref:uncharacterized protein LOC114724059 n=1 Tax=Neltuma alba TaxID=207710 RepID=UPI0010A4176C|nr:uncharacterized protein LOC114724059 [Prosopis alba]
MATAAFKSTTKRTPIPASSASSTDDSTSSRRNSSSHRRSRSLSRFSRRIPAQDTCNILDEFPAPRGRFVKTDTGSGFPEISLDDLAIAFFESGDRGRSTSRRNEASPASEIPASKRRGRSISSRRTGVANDGSAKAGDNIGGRRPVSDANPRRRRSVSVAPYQISDSESDVDHFHSAKSHVDARNSDIGNKLLRNPVNPSQKPVLRKSLSQKDLRSYSGNPADGPVMDSGSHIAMRKELRHAADEIRMANKQDVTSKRRSCEINPEKSDKRKQALLTEIALEEQRHRELSEVFKELCPHSKSIAMQKPSSARKRSSDRRGMSKRLTEEAERYIEDFISNVEDTDISSLDGERSDTSSSIGGLRSREAFNGPQMLRNVETDGVVLPWLQWETSNEASPASRNKMRVSTTPTTASSSQEITKARNKSNNSISSRGSWSPGGLPVYLGKDLSLEFGESLGFLSQAFSTEPKKELSYDVYEYTKSKSDEDFLIERWRQQHRIDSGSLMLCAPKLF